MTVFLGLVYPLAITGISQVVFPGKANGSKVSVDGKVVGSSLIGQSFSEPVIGKNGKPVLDEEGEEVLAPDPAYFQPRPSATGYSGNVTFFGNAAPNSVEAREEVREYMKAYLQLEKPFDKSLTSEDVPVDAVTQSASGVDPHISEANARIQAHRDRRRPQAAARPGRRPDLRQHRRPLPRRARRARRQRPRAQHRPRQGSADQMTTETQARSLFDPEILRPALLESVRKLDPRVQVRNPVMFVVEIGAVITTVAWLIQLFGGSPLGGGHEPSWFTFSVTVWLWLTVVFANLAEALAEGRGRAQAASLRAMRTEATAKMRDGGEKSAAELVRGDVVVVEAGEGIPGDGTVIEGIASVDESAITGESAPVIREAGGDRSAVTGGTKVLSDRIVVEITQEPGKSFLDRMIALVEGAERRKTPNEIALGILLSALTLIFVIVVVSLRPFALFAGTELSETTLIALLVALIPTTIGALLSAIGIAGMDRLVRRNVLALSGRAVEASGDCDVLLLDKTGTITLGNREATEFVPMPGVSEAGAGRGGADVLARRRDPGGPLDRRPRQGLRDPRARLRRPRADLRPLHRADADERRRLQRHPPAQGRRRRDRRLGRRRRAAAPRPSCSAQLDRIGREGGTPLAVARNERVLGVIYLKDVVKEGMKARFDQLRAMGIRTIMVTGDNKLTAAKIAEEAGVDDFLAEATPERKLELIKEQQADGRLIAMTGDGTNDAPALAQADVGVAMNTGTQAAREAGNMVDLDSNPTKLIEIVEVGKQLLITRGALTTFSIANDVAKYFAILPAMFAATYAVAGHERPARTPST